MMKAFGSVARTNWRSAMACGRLSAVNTIAFLPFDKVRQCGPEAQHLLIPRRGDFGIHADNAPELIPAHDEPRVVTAMAPVFEQQPAQRRQRPAIARPRCRPGQILFHFPS